VSVGESLRRHRAWSTRGAFLPLSPFDFRDLPATLDFAGKRFHVKEEFHITLGGSDLARRIAALTDAPACLQRILGRTALRQGWGYRLRRDRLHSTPRR